MRRNLFSLLLLIITPIIVAPMEIPIVASQVSPVEYLAVFSDPAHLWENNVERIIEEAFRRFFRTKIIDNRVMTIRIPFAMNNDRDSLLETRMRIVGHGKGTPAALWPVIEELLHSEDFQLYIDTLSSGREKVIIFDMANQTWSATTDHFVISRMKAGIHIGLPHLPHVLVSGRGAQESDINNYLFCIGLVGVDCSAFVWYILSYIAARDGMDLGRVLAPFLGVPRGVDPALFVGTSFFNSRSPQMIAVDDTIENLRPADIMLFRDVDGRVIHSAIIQSIDFERGIIRYLQCTNVGLPHERGVHDSFIYFNPANTAVSLGDPSLTWTKRRFPAFAGEEIPFADDGERFRHRAGGGGRVVRLRALIPVIERLNSR